MKAPERRYGRVLVSLLLTVNRLHMFFNMIFIIEFEQVNSSWAPSRHALKQN